MMLRIVSFFPPYSFPLGVTLTLLCGYVGLDTEYRYWTYMEAHPAHISLTPAAKSQALEALAWAYTGTFLLHYTFL